MAGNKYRVWIAGPRAWENPDPIEKVIRRLIAMRGIARLLVMTGGAPGVDHLAESICIEKGVHVFACCACWPVGRHAGPVRNLVIAEEFEPEVLVAFHYADLGPTGHRGTANAIKSARKFHVPVKKIRVRPEVALPSGVLDEAPQGTQARRELGLPPKAKRATKRRRKA